MVELLGVLGVTIGAEESGPALPAGVVALAAELAAYAGTTPEAAAALWDARARARADRDWARADAVRDGLAALGVRIEDTASGARVTVSGS